MFYRESTTLAGKIQLEGINLPSFDSPTTKKGCLHMKKITMLTVMLALLLFGCSNNDNNNNANNDDVNGGENTSYKNDTTVNNNDERGSLSPDEIIEILDEAFIDFDVEYNEDDKTFIFDSTDETFTDLVVGLTNGDYGVEEWEVYPENMIGISQMVTMAGDEHDYTFALRNPMKPDSLILIIKNDEVVYDFIEDI